MQHRILISEDDVDLTDTWSECLRRESFLVDIANDGETALKLWEKNPYDLVLLDLLTPKIRGGELLRRIKAKQPWTQVIIVSGEGKEQDKMDAVNLHVHTYLEKPVKFDDLLETITTGLADRDLAILSLETMVERSEDPSRPVVAIGRESFSTQRLFDEVRKGTEAGRSYLASLRKTLVEDGVDAISTTDFVADGIIE